MLRAPVGFLPQYQTEVDRFLDHLSVISMQVQLEWFCGGAAQASTSKIWSCLCSNTNTWQHWSGDHLSVLFTCLSTSLSPVFHLFYNLSHHITLCIHLCCRPLLWPEAPMVRGNTPHLWSASSLEQQPGLRNVHCQEHFLSQGLLLLEGKCGWWGGKPKTQITLRASGMR